MAEQTKKRLMTTDGETSNTHANPKKNKQIQRSYENNLFGSVPPKATGHTGPSQAAALKPLSVLNWTMVRFYCLREKNWKNVWFLLSKVTQDCFKPLSCIAPHYCPIFHHTHYREFMWHEHFREKGGEMIFSSVWCRSHVNSVSASCLCKGMSPKEMSTTVISMKSFAQVNLLNSEFQTWIISAVRHSVT